MNRDVKAEIASLNEEFFAHKHGRDPLTATELGLHAFDGQLPDLTRAGELETVEGYRALQRRIEALLGDDAGTGRHLAFEERINLEVMDALAFGTSTELEDELWARNISAGGYVAPQARIFQTVPTAPLVDATGIEAYLERLAHLPELFATIRERYRQADRQGQFSTSAGVRQAIAQLDGHLELGDAHDVFINVELPAASEGERDRIRSLVHEGIWPAIAALRDELAGDPLSHARGDHEVGLGAIEGGDELYARALGRHTTTAMTPEEIHQLGLETLARLDDEWAEIGSRVFGIRDRRDLFDRLRGDLRLRFDNGQQILDVVTHALWVAEREQPKWFLDRPIARCVIEEISAAEADNAALAYYRGPSDDGSRPGAHCVLTTVPTQRFRYEYEALAFHESVPGHHLQIGTAQTLKELPAFRRYLDAEVSAFVEGWGLYAERLADEMGLYSDDLARLGMLSFDALRASRCVVDTGMHYYGWSRQRAIEFMFENSATNMANVCNEIDRYIGWPAQATAYLVGRRELRRLRHEAERKLGSAFDIRQFHGVLLGQGAVPLGVLASVVESWIASLTQG
ncbi:DUF885 family protein [Ferrimicrobium sp.]|jgi:uncharacterized protein (DUF885 family)|uniref:DUF885 domain-containing protein n=1 Tax=Ferrimicrobium sp. TaxID=2926050 RepID=UPI00261B770A|nr:DUF885 domain-containing protein [Ferrimicrobium sp.]